MSDDFGDVAGRAYERFRNEFLTRIAERPDFVVSPMVDKFNPDEVLLGLGAAFAGREEMDRFHSEIAAASAIVSNEFGEMYARAAERVLREMLYGLGPNALDD